MNRTTIAAPSRQVIYSQAPDQEPVLAARQFRTTKEGSGCLSAMCFLAGAALTVAGVATLIFLPFGIGLLVLAFKIDSKRHRIFFCGNCGNDLSPTSQICPHCAAQLVED